MDGFELTGNTMKVFVDLDLETQSTFKEFCDQLAEVEDDPLYLDLSAAGFIGSSFFGELFILNHRIQNSGRTLIIRTSRQLLSIMELLGLPELVSVEVVDTEGDEADDVIK